MHLRLYSDVRLRKIFLKNFAVFVSLIFLIIAVLVFPYSNKLSAIYHKQLRSVNEDYLIRAGDMCDSVISDVESYIISISVRDEIRAYVLSDNTDDYFETVQNSLRFYKGINKYIYSVSLYSFDTKILVSDGSISYTNGEGESIYPKNDNKTSIDVCVKNNKYPFVISVMRCMEISNKRFAVIIDIDVERFGNLFENIEGDQINKFFIVTKNSEFVYGDNLKEYFKKPVSDIMKENTDGTAIVGNEKFVFSEKSSRKNDLIYVSLMPFDHYISVAKSYRMYMLLIVLASLALGILIALFMTKSSITPMDIILSEIDNMQTGSETGKIPIEIRYIVEDIRKVFKDKENLNGEMNSRILLLKLAQAQALQTQINPHFLHNTLEMINWMAFGALGKENEISKCITVLSEMFRKGLETDEYIVSLKDEVQHAKAYAQLLEIRFEGNVKIYFDIPDSFLEAPTLKFILQPLIENAVYHGIRPRENSGCIWIKAKKNENELIISVSDNGKGMSKQKLEKIQRELRSGTGNLDEQIAQIVRKWNTKENGENADILDNSWWLQRQKSDVGIGIKNINNRIKLIFGDKYGLRLYKNKHGGITSEVNLPIVKNQ